jgi:hypothetical protein
MTVIVWDDMAPNTQSRRPVSQPSRVAQILAQVESGVDMVIDLNKVQGLSRSLIHVCSCGPVEKEEF